MTYRTQSSAQTLHSTRFQTRFLLLIVQTFGRFSDISKLDRPSKQGGRSSLTKPNTVGAQRQLPGAFQFAPTTGLAGRIFVILTRGSRRRRALTRSRPFPRPRIHISCISALTHAGQLSLGMHLNGTQQIEPVVVAMRRNPRAVKLTRHVRNPLLTEPLTAVDRLYLGYNKRHK